MASAGWVVDALAFSVETSAIAASAASQTAVRSGAAAVDISVTSVKFVTKAGIAVAEITFDLVIVSADLAAQIGQKAFTFTVQVSQATLKAAAVAAGIAFDVGMIAAGAAIEVIAFTVEGSGVVLGYTLRLAGQAPLILGTVLNELGESLIETRIVK